MSVYSVMEDVDVVVAYMRKIKKLDADPVNGPNSLYSEAEFKSKMECGDKYSGVAGNLFWLNLKRLSLECQPITPEEAASFAEANFSISKKLDANKLLDDLRAAGDERHRFRGFIIPRPTLVVCNDRVLPGVKTEMRKASMDIVIYGLIQTFARWLRGNNVKSMEDVKSKALEILVDTCLHWPMDFQYFEPNTSLEEKILLASVQVMEDIKNDGENLAAGGWQLVCIFFQLGQIKKLSNGTGEHDVVQASLGSINLQSDQS
jgi:hypothetical protein